MTPLDLLYSWQSLFLAVVIATLTQSFKSLVELLIERHSGGDGRAKRKASVVNNTLLPMFPLVLGGLIGRFSPIRPEYLVQFVNENHTNMMVYVMWGASIGQFSDYLYQRAKAFIPLASPWNEREASPVAPPSKSRKNKTRRKPKRRVSPSPAVPPPVPEPDQPAS